MSITYLFQSSDCTVEDFNAGLHPEELVVFSDWKTLMNAAVDSPFAVILDLDWLRKKREDWELALGEIRARFPLSELIGMGSSEHPALISASLRAGFSDFLLQPVEMNELKWTLARSRQKFQSLAKWSAGKNLLMEAVARVSSSQSEALIRLVTLTHLKKYFSAERAIWINAEAEKPEITCEADTVVTNSDENVFEREPSDTPYQVNYFRRNKTREIILAVPHATREWILLRGVPHKVMPSSLEQASTLVCHAASCLAHLARIKEVNAQTYLDELTGLYNSRFFRHSIKLLLREIQTDPAKSFSVLFVDIDYFKTVNDTHGHLVGSDCLVAVGRFLKHCVRQKDLVFRYGGDEFIILLKESSAEQAFEIAERLRSLVEQKTFVIRGRNINTTLSVGLASAPVHSRTEDELIKLADDAMYESKKKSRNRVSVATPTNPEINLSSETETTVATSQ